MKDSERQPFALEVEEGCYIDRALVERANVVAFLKREADRCYADGAGDSSLANCIVAEGDALLVAASEIEAGKHVLEALGLTAPCDRSGEADETATKIAGSAEGESAVPAKPAGAQPPSENPS